jgi:hypothetical protein
VHAVAVEFDLVQPLIVFRRRVDQPGELRRDPLRQGRRAWMARYRPRHAGGGNGSTAPAHAPPRGGRSRRHAWDDTTAPKLVSFIAALAVATTAPSARESQSVNLGQTAKIVRWGVVETSVFGRHLLTLVTNN